MSDDKTGKTSGMNLDLIQMVQRARMAHDSTAKPSEIAAVYWIESKRQAGEYPDPTPRIGEWVIETDVAQVDGLWQVVKSATEAGKLGYKSKVSTASRSGQNPNQRVIIALTYDAADHDDVERVKQALIELGIDEAHLHFEGV